MIFSSKVVRNITLVLAFIVSTGCSFQLRNNYHIPDILKTLTFNSSDPYGYFSRTLERNLRRHHIDLMEESNDTTPDLRILKNFIDKSNLTVYSDGQIAEYRLTYTVQFSLRKPKQDPKVYSIQVQRYYVNNDETALAKDREMKLIIKEMEVQAADRVLRQLSITH